MLIKNNNYLGSDNIVNEYEYIYLDLPISWSKEQLENILELIKNNIDPFNSSSEFYLDVCNKYTTPTNDDIYLQERKNKYYPDLSFCEENCDFIKFNKDNYKITCKCKPKNNTNYYEKILFKQNYKNEEFIKTFTSPNLKVIKCKSIIIKTLNKNFGFFFTFILLFIFFILFIFALNKNENKEKNFSLDTNDSYLSEKEDLKSIKSSETKNSETQSQKSSEKQSDNLISEDENEYKSEVLKSKLVNVEKKTNSDQSSLHESDIPSESSKQNEIEDSSKIKDLKKENNKCKNDEGKCSERNSEKSCSIIQSSLHPSDIHSEFSYQGENSNNSKKKDLKGEDKEIKNDANKLSSMNKSGKNIIENSGSNPSSLHSSDFNVSNHTEKIGINAEDISKIEKVYLDDMIENDKNNKNGYNINKGKSKSGMMSFNKNIKLGCSGSSIEGDNNITEFVKKESRKILLEESNNTKTNKEENKIQNNSANKNEDEKVLSLKKNRRKKVNIVYNETLLVPEKLR